MANFLNRGIVPIGDLKKFTNKSKLKQRVTTPRSAYFSHGKRKSLA